jgi:hypothetical protein
VRSRPHRCGIVVLAFLVLAGCGRSAVPVWTGVEPLGRLGGDFSMLVKARHAGRTVVLKSNRPSSQLVEVAPGRTGRRALTRWSNFESDLVAGLLFDRMGVRAPRAEVVRLDRSGPGSTLAKELGETVLAMEFVDESWAGAPVEKGRWPGPERADIRAFAALASVDILLGNADRTGDNFFLARGTNGLLRPVPIDNNAGLASFLVWSAPTCLVNFVPSYDGVGPGQPWKLLGSIGNVLVREGQEQTVHANLFAGRPHWPQLRAEAGRLVRLLTDAEIDRLVNTLPPEVIPAGMELDTGAPWLPGAGAIDRAALFGAISGRLSGAAVFPARVAEIRRVLRWRRDHLVDAVERFLRDLED